MDSRNSLERSSIDGPTGADGLHTDEGQPGEQPFRVKPEFSGENNSENSPIVDSVLQSDVSALFNSLL